MLLEGLANMIGRYLRVPLGASVRHASSSPMADDCQSNDYVQVILEITRDDVCIGETPLSHTVAQGSDSALCEKVEQVEAELNTIVKDVTYDLLADGYSVYTSSVNHNTNHLILLPYIEPVQFYLTYDKKIVAVKGDGEILERALIFINWDKRSLARVEATSSSGSEYAYCITPAPCQLRYAGRAASQLNAAEQHLDRYRAVTSRIARWINVDVGTLQGDQQQQIVDSVSSAINADSTDLSSVGTGFDDNLPVLPNRKGLGRAEIQADIPNYDLSNVADIDHYISKLGLTTRFPASYLDFGKTLDGAAVTLLRGDVRYAKLCVSTRSIITTTLNEWFKSSEKFQKLDVKFSMTSYPTSEDSDTMDALQSYTDLDRSVTDFVMPDPSNVNKEDALFRLHSLRKLYESSTSSPSLSAWFEHYEDYLQGLNINSEHEGTGAGGFDGGHDDFGGGLDDLGGDIDSNIPEQSNSDVTPPEGPEVEFTDIKASSNGIKSDINEVNEIE